MRTLQQAIDWARRVEPANIYISSFPRKTQKAMQILVAEVERLKRLDDMLCHRCHGIGEITAMSGQTPENFSQENIPCPDCIGPIIDERDKYKSALEWIAYEANTGEGGDSVIMREAAEEALK